MAAAATLIEHEERFTAAAQTILDARADPRVGVNFPVTIFGAGSNEFLKASARDLSVGGICIATDTPFALGTIQRLRLELSCGTVDVKAHGRWQTRPAGDTSILSGARFIAPTAPVISLLWDAVNAAGKEICFFMHGDSELQGLSLQDANDFGECSRYRMVAARQMVYKAGECGPGDDSIFILKEGEVSLRVRLSASREVTLARLRPGGIFGGLPIVADLPNQESVVADTDASILEISRASFSYIRVAKPLLAQRIAQIVTRVQLQRAARLVELARMTA